MEATESFSYSWLSNSKPSSIEETFTDEASFIEMDPRLPPSKRFSRVSSDFVFDFPVTESPLGLVHADQLFSNGLLLPLFVNDMKMERFEAQDYYISSSSKKTRWSRCASMRSCRRLSKRLFHKYFKWLLRPFFQTKRRESGGVASRSSTATSPRTSLAYSGDDNWRRSCDSESSIYEAVLHCKRTHGK